ncbi:MAG: hypothetical protein JO336_04825, partial [Acidobacteriia bacterium]|nr:hypothetical protein [Terriglobia bacterium]
MKHILTITAAFAAASLTTTTPAFSQGSAPAVASKPAKAAEPAKPTPRLPDGKVDFGGKGV